MGNAESSATPPRPPPLLPSQLPAHVSWCLQQAARLHHQQSLHSTILFSPLTVPSASPSSTSTLLSHLSSSIAPLTSLIDLTLSNKDPSQSLIHPKEDRIRAYTTPHSSSPLPPTPPPTSPSLYHPLDPSTLSRQQRVELGHRSLLLSSLSSTLLTSSLHCQLLLDLRAYLSKTPLPYYADQHAAELSRADADLATLLPLLSLGRSLLPFLYRDVHLLSLLYTAQEWTRVLTGLQATWRGAGAPYIPPSSPTSTCPISYSSLSPPPTGPLIGISLTSPLQTHIGPSSPPPSPLTPPDLTLLLDLLHSRATALSTALHHNEVAAISAVGGWLPPSTVFSWGAEEVRKVGGRVVGVLGLKSGGAGGGGGGGGGVRGEEVVRGVGNMRTRLSTLLTALTHVGEGSPQWEVVVGEAAAEAKALRDVYALCMPQVVGDLVKAMKAAGEGAKEREREEIREGLRGFEMGAAPLPVPPPVPRRPSLNTEEKEKALMRAKGPSVVEAAGKGEASNGERLDGERAGLGQRAGDRGDVDKADSGVVGEEMGEAPIDAVRSVPLEVQFNSSGSLQGELPAISVETPGATKHWWREPLEVGEVSGDGGSADASRVESYEYEDAGEVDEDARGGVGEVAHRVGGALSSGQLPHRVGAGRWGRVGVIGALPSGGASPPAPSASAGAAAGASPSTHLHPSGVPCDQPTYQPKHQPIHQSTH